MSAIPATVVHTKYRPYTEPEGFQGTSLLANDCTICKETLREGVVIGHPNPKALDHLVHEVCMKAWVNTCGDGCVTCRAKVTLSDFLTAEEILAREQTIENNGLQYAMNLYNISEGEITEEQLLFIRGVIRLGQRLEEAQGAVQSMSEPKTIAEVLKDKVVFLVTSFCKSSLFLVSILTAAKAALDGLAAAWTLLKFLTPLAGISILRLTFAGLVGTIVGIAVARFLGDDPRNLESSTDNWMLFGMSVMVFTDYQIKSVALAALGIAGVGAAYIGVGLAAKGVYYAYSRYNSQVPAQ